MKHKIRDFTKFVPHPQFDIHIKLGEFVLYQSHSGQLYSLQTPGFLFCLSVLSLRVSEFSHLCSDRRYSVSSRQDVSSSA